MRISALGSLLFAAIAAIVCRAARGGDDIPEPRLDRVDYAHPEKYLDVPKTLGAKATIEKIAGEIQGATKREKLTAIGTWMDAHLKYDATSFDHWRDVDKLLADGTFGGCADHAEFFGAVARACGIPTVWVKTLDLDWIAWFHAHPDQPKSWNGHVFVEVHLDGRWRLYDASQKVLYEDYDVKERILPGHRLAYDKGGDPREMLLSTCWEEWKKQTRKFVETLDMSLVPVGEGISVRVDPPGLVYVAANNPEWAWICDRCKRVGFSTGTSGNCEWEKWMPGARRGILIVVSVAGRTVLPEQYWPLLPVAPAKFRDALGDKPSEIVRKKAADGTDVVLVMARDKESLEAAVAELTLGGAPALGAKEKGANVGPRGVAYVAARSAAYYALCDRCRKFGLTVAGGDAAFDKWMPGARGGLLVVALVGDDAFLPETYRSLLPADADKVREILKAKESDVLRKKAADGTDVVLVVARDKDAMKAAIETLTLDAPK